MVLACSCGRMTASLVLGLVIAATIAAPAAAVDAVLSDQRADLRIQVVNPASDEPVVASRALVREPGAILETIAETGRFTGETVIRSIDVLNFKPYVVTVWVDGVEYHAKHSGQDFLDGKPAIVYAFDTTDSLDGVTVTGLNIVLKRRSIGYDYEAIVTLENQSRPQRTVRADVYPLQLALPDGLRQPAVSIDRGPDPGTAPLTRRGDWQALAFPLPPGQARVTVSGQVLSDGEVRFDVGTNLPVAAWSLMTAPADIDVRSADLRRDDEAYGGMARWRGEPLDADERAIVRVTATGDVAAAPVFSDPVTSDPTVNESQTPRPKFPWLTVVMAMILIGLYVLWKFQRRR